MTERVPQLEIDGRPPTVESLWAAMAGGYGHLTAMQVRERRTRGLELHLDRLEEGSRVLFDADLDREVVRERIRHALGDTRDASVRVYIFAAAEDQDPSTMVTVRGPASMPSEPRSLRSVPYQRTLAHIKHSGGFGQDYYGRQAAAAGFDEALLVAPDGAIAEGAITNIGFIEAGSVVWPDAPALQGVSMQLIERALRTAGIGSVHRSINVTDVGTYDGGFICNSRGVAPVGRIDGISIPTDVPLVSTVMRLFDAIPWDGI